MVTGQGKKSFADDGSYQLDCKASCQENCSSQVTSHVEIPLYPDIHEKPHIAGEEIEEVLSQSQHEDMPGGDPVSELSGSAEQNPGSRKHECQYANDPGSIWHLRSVTSYNHEVVRSSEHVKRPLTMDGSPKHPYKRARQLDYCGWQVSFEFPSFRSAPGEPFLSVDACKESRDKRVTIHKEPSGNAFGSTSCFSLVSCDASEEAGRSELPVQISSPFYAVDKGQSSGFVHPDDVYLSVLDYYPRKHVAFGPDHQADIPEWNPKPIKKPSKELGPGVCVHHVTDDDDDANSFMGTCIIPMPDLTTVALEDAITSVTRSGCSCLDEGSIRCVKQHLMEARERLKEMLGLDAFTEMGFYNMGECVAHKWTEEEEQTFLEVVSANPASLGKNFWDQLRRVFPSRSCNELVSYYFNVFMLRKRAEQNRSDPLNIDSDNDEWQGSDDGEFAVEDYESDSVVETPGDQDDVYDNISHEEDDFHVDEDDDEDACNDFVAVEGHRQELDGFSTRQMHPKSSYSPRIQYGGVDAHEVAEDHDIQDDSCTSFEGQHIGANSASGPPTVEYSGLNKNHNRDVGLGSALDPSCIVSPDAKAAWGSSYFSGKGKSVDFLPTCHVIEEVLGNGSWGDETGNEHGIS